MRVVKYFLYIKFFYFGSFTFTGYFGKRLISDISLGGNFS